MPDNFTPESSLIARESIDAQRALYRKEYADDDYWKELAKERGVRMPPFYTRPSDQDIKHWLKMCKVSYAQFVEAFGWKDAEEFEQMNPTHGMKILAGLILELGEENIRIKKIARERAEDFLVNTGSSEPPKTRLYVGKSKARRRAEK